MFASAQSTTSRSVTGDDKNLMALFRSGSVAAFEELYRRHRRVALYVARSTSDSPEDGEEIVSEAFLAVFQVMRAGGGPDEFFRGYLLSTVRRLAHQRNAVSRRLARLNHDLALQSSPVEGQKYLAKFEELVLAQAFGTLPDRWKMVLWCIDVEGMKPAAVARYIDSSPNGVSSLLARAREGLRQAYLQQHVSKPSTGNCGEVSSRFGKLVRGAISDPTRLKIARHLATCTSCTTALSEVEEVQASMRPKR